MSETLIEDLRKQLEKQQVVVVVGSGVSIGATGGAPAASWGGLLKLGIQRALDLDPNLSRWRDVCIQELELGLESDLDSLLGVAEKVQRKLQGPEFARWLLETIGELKVVHSDVIEAVSALGVPIATTNYDSLLSDLTGLEPIPWTDTTNVEKFLRGDKQAILHLHGHFKTPESVILGIRNYQNIAGNTATQEIMRSFMLTKSTLFVGCGEGLSDPNIGKLLNWHQTHFQNSHYRHFRLDRSLPNSPAGAAPLGRLFTVHYGASHDDLAPFLKGLSQAEDPSDDPPNARRTVVSTDRALTPLFESELGNTKFVGRQRVLVELRKSLGQCQVTLLTGLGGTGKTRLAQEALADSDKLPEVVVFDNAHRLPELDAECFPPIESGKSVLLIARTGYDDIFRSLARKLGKPILQIHLSGLSPQCARSLATEITPHLDNDRLGRIIQRSNGNPLLIILQSRYECESAENSEQAALMIIAGSVHDQVKEGCHFKAREVLNVIGMCRTLSTDWIAHLCNLPIDTVELICSQLADLGIVVEKDQQWSVTWDRLAEGLFRVEYLTGPHSGTRFSQLFQRVWGKVGKDTYQASEIFEFLGQTFESSDSESAMLFRCLSEYAQEDPSSTFRYLEHVWHLDPEKALGVLKALRRFDYHKSERADCSSLLTTLAKALSPETVDEGLLLFIQIFTESPASEFYDHGPERARYLVSRVREPAFAGALIASFAAQSNWIITTLKSDEVRGLPFLLELLQSFCNKDVLGEPIAREAFAVVLEKVCEVGPVSIRFAILSWIYPILREDAGLLHSLQETLCSIQSHLEDTLPCVYHKYREIMLLLGDELEVDAATKLFGILWNNEQRLEDAYSIDIDVNGVLSALEESQKLLDEQSVTIARNRRVEQFLAQLWKSSRSQAESLVSGRSALLRHFGQIILDEKEFQSNDPCNQPSEILPAYLWVLEKLEPEISQRILDWCIDTQGERYLDLILEAASKSSQLLNDKLLQRLSDVCLRVRNIEAFRSLGKLSRPHWVEFPDFASRYLGQLINHEPFPIELLSSDEQNSEDYRLTWLHESVAAVAQNPPRCDCCGPYVAVSFAESVAARPPDGIDNALEKLIDQFEHFPAEGHWGEKSFIAMCIGAIAGDSDIFWKRAKTWAGQKEKEGLILEILPNFVWSDSFVARLGEVLDINPGLIDDLSIRMHLVSFRQSRALRWSQQKFEAVREDRLRELSESSNTYVRLLSKLIRERLAPNDQAEFKIELLC